MRYTIILLIFILLSCGCNSGIETEPTPSIGREMTETEYMIWELTIGCFMDSGIDPYPDMAYDEPRILVVDNEEDVFMYCGEHGGKLSAACAPAWDNRVVVYLKYYNEADTEPEVINASLFVHEFKHIIMYQAGDEEWGNHGNFWYSDMSLCSDKMLDEEYYENS